MKISYSQAMRRGMRDGYNRICGPYEPYDVTFSGPLPTIDPPRTKVRWRTMARYHVMLWLHAIRTRPLALLRSRGRFFIMPVDHKPTPSEVLVAEHVREQRHKLPPGERELLRNATVNIYADCMEEDGGLERWQQMMETQAGELPAGMYTYPESNDG